jgi:hypothetical protein
MGRAPKWSDDKAVAAWVGKVIDDAALDEEYEHSQLPWDTLPDIPASFIFEDMERQAVEAAQGGNFRPLADMLERINPLFKLAKWNLGPRAIALIARRLRGEPIAKRGRPKQTAERRQLNTRTHDAAAELKEIERILRQHYPSEKKIKERATSIAATRAGIKHDTLVNYLKRPRRRRLP